MVVLKKALVISLPIWAILFLDTMLLPYTRIIPNDLYSPGFITIILLNPTWAGIHNYSSLSLVLYNCIFYFWIVVGLLLVLSRARKITLPVPAVKWLVTLAGLTVITFVSLGIWNRVSNKLYKEKWSAAYEQVLQITLEADTLRPYFCTAADGLPVPVVLVDDIAFEYKRAIQLEAMGQSVELVSSLETDSRDSTGCYWDVDFIYFSDTSAGVSLRDIARKVEFWAEYHRTAGTWFLSKLSIDSITTDTLTDNLTKRVIESLTQIRERYHPKNDSITNPRK